MYDFYVVLGCFGYRVDDFVHCNGIENVILKVGPSTNDYQKMMDYFEQCRLFDKPMFDMNGIRHVIHNLNDRFDQVYRPLWTPKKYELYQKFVNEHRRCGLLLKLTLPEDFKQSSTPPEPIIMVNNTSVAPTSPAKLRLVSRGKR